MPTLRFTIKGIEFQYAGEQEEIIAFINRFLSDRSISLEHEKPILQGKPEQKIEGITPLKLDDLPLPPLDNIVEYITSKPKFTHDLLDVQRKFFGKTFHSRGKEQRMYHRTSRQLKIAREIIEKRDNGKFKEDSAGRRNLKRFTFAKHAPLTLTFEETTDPSRQPR